MKVGALAVSAALALAACGSSGGGGGSSSSASGAGGGGGSSSSAAKVVKVGMAYDVGGRGDKSFNDLAAAGLDKAKTTLNVQTKELAATPGESEQAKESRLQLLAQQGYNPIVAVGFAYATAVGKVVPSFPNTKFAIVDDDSIQLPNVTPLVFAEEQGSFLAGVAAAYKSKNCHIGFVGGVNTPLIQKFEAGFLQGAKTVSSKIKIEDEYLTPAGDFSGFQDPPKGNAKAQAEIAKGADVIYHAAGASGKGVFDAAKAGNALAIGVDSDQYNQKTVAADKDIIITSMLKRVDVAVFDYIQAVAKGDLSVLPKRFDLKVDGVGYATSGGKIDDIKDVLDGYKAQIISGQITVSDKPQK
jgi:basic membrane protein A